MSRAKAKALFATLEQERPSFHGVLHGEANAGSRNWAISPAVLRWIVDNVPEGGHTLETGCGYTSVIFAALGKRHTVVSPLAEEHELIRQWCEARGLPMDHVEFVAAFSQDVIAGLEPGPLHAVLIDGDHAFPAPMIDWYYSADRVVKDGFVIVDDTQIPSGTILRDFLKSETTRWAHVGDLGKTDIFRRTTESPVARGVHWTEQPYCEVRRRTPGFLGRLSHPEGRVRRLLRRLAGPAD